MYDDIKLYLQNFQTRNYNPLKLVVRKWENIDPGTEHTALHSFSIHHLVSEVRAFVIQNEIKVMTQYSPYYYFPDFANEARKERLQTVILKYFEVR